MSRLIPILVLLLLASCSQLRSRSKVIVALQPKDGRRRTEEKDSSMFTHAFAHFYRDKDNNFYLKEDATELRKMGVKQPDEYIELPSILDSATFKEDDDYLSDSTHLIYKGRIFSDFTLVPTAPRKFLHDSANWRQLSCGTLDGLDPGRKDSASNLCFASSFGNPSPYELIFLYQDSVTVRNRLGHDSIQHEFFRESRRHYLNFDCFAFELNTANPKSFPAEVRAYRRIARDHWYFLFSAPVPSYAVYRDLQFRTIYANYATFAQ